MEYLFSIVALLINFFLGGGPADFVVDQPTQESQIAQVISVIDGDTVTVEIDGVTQTVRYIGIDTPEPRRDGEPACYSAQATAANSDLVSGREVRLVADAENTDRYGRLLRYVYVDDVFVNQALLQSGHAIIMSIRPNTAMSEQLLTTEQTARDTGVGLWSACASASNDKQTTQASTAQLDPVTVTADQMTDGQRQLLETLGIDATAFEFTQKMISCAQTAVGVDRLIEITTGQTPTFIEGLSLARCYMNS